MADDAGAADTELEQSTALDESSCPAGTPTPDDAQDQREPVDPGGPDSQRDGLRLALAAGVVSVVALGALVGWLGFRSHELHQDDQKRAVFLAAARQGALNLTTISYTEVDADIKRILDSATGAFYDDFQKRSQPFIDVVKQAQSKSEGTITEAGLEAVQGDTAQALVSVKVTTSNAGAAEQQPRAWRMRVDVRKVGDAAKVSNVEFVP